MSDIVSKNFDIAIIGGGASGMMAAIFLAKTLKKSGKNAKIAILERHFKLGRKVLATGNGTCNLSNEKIESGNLDELYFSNYPDLYRSVLNNYDLSKTLDFFSSLGLVTTIAQEGKIYPYSKRASDVVEIFQREIDIFGIDTELGYEVHDISKTKQNKFLISGQKREKDIKEHVKSYEQNIIADYVILAAGGKASPNLSSDGLGYVLAKKLGHTLTKIYPSIAQIKTVKDINKKLTGLRWDVNISLLGRTASSNITNTITKQFGELLFTEYGISGPVSLNLARHIYNNEEENYKYYASIDFLPEFDNHQLIDFFNDRIKNKGDYPANELFVGLLPNKLAHILASNVLGNDLIKNITKDQIKILILSLKKYEIQITGTTGFSKAQVTAGGVSCNEINVNTLESKICKNLYFCGEILDVDGICGGYNLQFAWSSGMLVAESVSKLL